MLILGNGSEVRTGTNWAAPQVVGGCDGACLGSNLQTMQNATLTSEVDT